MYRHVADPVVLEIREIQVLIRAEHRATMAAADFTAIEHVLDREIDVDTLRLAGNFDAVTKGRHGRGAQLGCAPSLIHSTAGCAGSGFFLWSRGGRRT